MTAKNVKKLHNDHAKWNYAVEQWLLEIKNLLEDLVEIEKSNPSEKIKKYVNHLKHNQRFLSEMLEVIESHELFLNEYEEMGMPGTDIEMDHYKTEAHIKDFEIRFDKLKTKIQSLLESNSV